MIKLICLDGPFYGNVRIFEGITNLETGKEVRPFSLLKIFLIEEWQWEINYSQATDQEKLEWLVEDLSARAIRALKAGLPVFFQDKAYRVESLENYAQVANRLEQDIGDSEKMISIDSDDKKGLVIGISK